MIMVSFEIATSRNTEVAPKQALETKVSVFPEDVLREIFILMLTLLSIIVAFFVVF